MLPVHPKRTATGRERFEPWACTEKLPDQRRRPDHLLEVVEHEQEFFVAQMILEGFRERVFGALPDAKGSR